ncbi:MAG TPA: hypothetical protein VE870_14045 [Bacteroidales bacterium]|nr:hypothetical protein [Bacteroidales bacterium]
MVNVTDIRFIVVLFFICGNLNAQKKNTIVFKQDTTGITDDTLILEAGDYRGTIEWQVSEDQYYWRSIEGANTDNLIIEMDSCSYYRYMVSEGTCDPVYSEITQVYVPDTCTFNQSGFIGPYVTVLEHWNNKPDNSYYSVGVVRNDELSTNRKLVLDITGLFTGKKDSHYSIAIDMETQLILAFPDDVIVVDTDVGDTGYGRLWFDDFTAPYVSTCNGYLKFTVTPYLHDTGLWYGSTVTYYIGPGAVNIRYEKKSACETNSLPLPCALKK